MNPSVHLCCAGTLYLTKLFQVRKNLINLINTVNKQRKMINEQRLSDCCTTQLRTRSCLFEAASSQYMFWQLIKRG